MTEFFYYQRLTKKSVTCAPKPLILWNGIKAVREDKGHFMVPFLCHIIYALFSSHQIKCQKLLHFMFFFSFFWQHVLLLQPCLHKRQQEHVWALTTLRTSLGLQMNPKTVSLPNSANYFAFNNDILINFLSMVLIFNNIISRAANAPEAEGSAFYPCCFELGVCITHM